MSEKSGPDSLGEETRKRWKNPMEKDLGNPEHQPGSSGPGAPGEEIDGKTYNGFLIDFQATIGAALQNSIPTLVQYVRKILHPDIQQIQNQLQEMQQRLERIEKANIKD